MKKMKRRVVLLAVALSLSLGVAACGQSTGGRSSIERDDDYALGNPDAPVTIIEYASLTCPACATFHRTIYPELKAKYVETGKVRFIFRQFPTAPARLAVGGEAVARCKGSSDIYFEVVDLLFEKQRLWVSSQNPGQALRDLGATVGISAAEFDACVADEANVTRIQEVVKHAVDTWAVNSTPSFIINGDLAKNMRSIEDFAAIIDPILAGSEGGKKGK
ncbi:MAG: DsbA family protein [Robiginitomaculum sp.]|nr:DsbA family protein [Robiginitomaculum sp.]